LSAASRQPEPTRVRLVSQISEARRQIVEKARQSWIRKLIDLSRRNNLLYFRPLKTGTLELTSAPNERLRDLLMGQSVAVAKLAPDLENEALTKILRDISRRALENSEEKGLSTLFVTFGMATWPALDGGRPAESPVLLLPGLAWGAAGRLHAVQYPADWLTARQLLDADPAPGTVLLLPWAQYRRYPWNSGEAVFDPWSRLLSRTVIYNDALTVGDQTIGQEGTASIAEQDGERAVVGVVGAGVGDD